FTCMPEIVAKSILPQISKDYGMPVMTLVLDEHAGEAGIMTRIEAFVDLLERRRKQEDVRYERIFGS
ncbi:MAG: CoA protein activase, partial [Bacillota bacterium]